MQKKFSILLDAVANRLKKIWLSSTFFISTLLIGFLGIVYGFWQISQWSGISSQVSAYECEQDFTNELGTITTSISGAVEQPGSYNLPHTARTSDLIQAAGGFTDKVDPVFLERQFNGAGKLTDEFHLYIPSIDEQEIAEVCNQIASQSDVKSDRESSGLISINNATTKELESLPGIGQKRAEDIVAGRPYQTLNDLLNFGVVGESVFTDIQEMLTL